MAEHLGLPCTHRARTPRTTIRIKSVLECETRARHDARPAIPEGLSCAAPHTATRTNALASASHHAIAGMAWCPPLRQSGRAGDCVAARRGTRAASHDKRAAPWSTWLPVTTPPGVQRRQAQVSPAMTWLQPGLFNRPYDTGRSEYPAPDRTPRSAADRAAARNGTAATTAPGP